MAVIRPRLLSWAIRSVERNWVDYEGIDFTGPPPEWYDEYALRVARAYNSLIYDFPPFDPAQYEPAVDDFGNQYLALKDTPIEDQDHHPR